MLSKKENLFLVHSFPTNSSILKGLVVYLERFFNLYFIDLPGFLNNEEDDRKEKISLDYYSNYISQEIKKHNLDSFMIGGISFGFLVANNAEFDVKKCKAILAIEPYLNISYLNIGFVKRFLYYHLIDRIIKSDLEEKIWESPFADEFISFMTG